MDWILILIIAVWIQLKYNDMKERYEKKEHERKQREALEADKTDIDPITGNFTSKSDGMRYDSYGVLIGIAKKKDKKSPTGEVVRETLKDILPLVSLLEISNQYWVFAHEIYDKLNDVDNKTKFTEQEIKELRKALYDISKRITKAADLLYIR
ncbi:MAG: hypothetical protein K5854_09250 [Prevotella sp.]|nr:hypothetical protein [Prevotella sp.]